MEHGRASDRFWAVFGCGYLIGLLFWLLDPPRAVRVVVVVVWAGLLCWAGVLWGRGALRDGSFRRALPEYGWALVSLLLLAAVFAGATLVVLLVAGESVTATALSTGAFIGLCVALPAWWLMRRVRRA